MTRHPLLWLAGVAVVLVLLTVAVVLPLSRSCPAPGPVGYIIVPTPASTPLSGVLVRHFS
jgi:hypothetical protein